MPKQQIHRGLVSFNAAISACHGAAWQVALELLRSMEHEEAVLPDVISCSSVISACEERWPMALQLFKSMFKRDLRPDQITFNATIRACAKDGQWHLALELLEAMEDDEILGESE
eukprot:Skav218336  [mRNA]  locus=scaffold755:379513:382566:+ [translate_table: standard]